MTWEGEAMAEGDRRADAVTGLRRYRSAVEQHLAIRARELGLHSTDLSALSHVIDHARLGHALSPGELGQAIALSGPATTAVIDRLERGGWVERRHSTDDGRRIELHLTRRVAGKRHELADPFFAELYRSLDGFTAEQLELFEVMITTLANRLEVEAHARSNRARVPTTPRSPRSATR